MGNALSVPLVERMGCRLIKADGEQASTDMYFLRFRTIAEGWKKGRNRRLSIALKVRLSSPSGPPELRYYLTLSWWARPGLTPDGPAIGIQGATWSGKCLLELLWGTVRRQDAGPGGTESG